MEYSSCEIHAIAPVCWHKTQCAKNMGLIHLAKCAALLSLLLVPPAANAQIWSIYADDMTYIKTSDAALARTKFIYQKMSKKDQESSPFIEKIAVGIGSHIDPSHCQTPYELARTVPRDIAARTSTITFCRRAIYFATYNLSSIMLLDIMNLLDDSDKEQKLLASIVARNIRMFTEDYSSIAAGKPVMKVPCSPMELIYAMRFAESSNYCRSLSDMVKPPQNEVEKALWPILAKNAKKLEFDVPPGGPSNNLWIIQRWFIETVAQGIFDSVAAHELGHIVHGDSFNSRRDASTERQADEFAVSILSEGSQLMRASLAALNASLILHVGSALEHWQAQAPNSSLDDRLFRSSQHAACLISSTNWAQNARNAQERQFAQSARARLTGLPIKCP